MNFTLAAVLSAVFRSAGLRRRCLRMLLALATAAGGSAAVAQHGTAADMPPGAAGAPRGFLWEARKGGAQVLLMGTIHLGRDGQTTLPAGHAALLRGSAALVLEADVFDAQRVQAAMQRHALRAPSTSGLDRALPAPLRARVQQRIESAGLAPEIAWRFKPWALANNLVVLEAMRGGLSPAYSTEAQLVAVARSAGLPVLELESVEAQLALFDAMPDGLSLAYLEEAVGGIERGESQREIADLVEAWRAGDDAAMARQVDRMRAAVKPVDRWVSAQLIESRHPAMLDRIERMAASGRLHLVAVGTLHFFGPEGLLAGLRARGYSITRLP